MQSDALSQPRKFLSEIFGCAVAAADPMLRIPPALPPKPKGRVLVDGAGKASARMAEAAVGAFVDHCSHPRCRENIGNVTPADTCFGREEANISERRANQRADNEEAPIDQPAARRVTSNRTSQTLRMAIALRSPNHLTTDTGLNEQEMKVENEVTEVWTAA